MPKRALIAEPDHEEALRQAAMLKDDGYDAQVFAGGDLVEAVQQNPPDVLILRQERLGGQTGMALIPRLKSAAKGTAIVLTTSDLTSEAIEKHKRQKVHADSYLRIPADRTEFVDAAHSVPQVHEADEVAQTIEHSEIGRVRPPPLPPSGLRGLTQARALPRHGGEAVLTADDLTFVEKVFSTIQHVDIEQPPDVQTQQERLLDGGDRKVVLLRTELKRRERELAKLSRLWKAREEDLRQKEARVEQKDIEIEGMRLRVQELSDELERANATLVAKEDEFGKAIGETYDSQALQQAELIQAVAKKENELNALKTKLRRTEDAAAEEQKGLTERIFEWEKAYATLEQHHWKVVDGSVDEMRRLENSIAAREHRGRELLVRLREAENAWMAQRARAEVAERRARELEHTFGRFQEFAQAQLETWVLPERRALSEASAQLREAQQHVTDLENDVYRGRQLLLALNAQRTSELSHIAAVSRAQSGEIVRLQDERRAYQLRSEQLTSALSLTTALGEATAAQLFGLEDKRRMIGDAQARVRDAKITDLREEIVRISTQLSDVTERLGQSEMEHAAEHARAEGLDTSLQQLRDVLADTEHNLSSQVDALSDERARLAEQLKRTEDALEVHKEELATTRAAQKQREAEVQGIFERKDHDISTRSEKLIELERALQDAKEDLANLRKTVTLRDDRITELLSRARTADEQNVALEGQVFRLNTQNTEKDAELFARAERLQVVADKLSARENRVLELENDTRRIQGLLLDKQAHAERQEQTLAQTANDLARAREDAARLKTELDGRAQELFESERKASALSNDLAHARADIEAGAAVQDQLHAQLAAQETRQAELRQKLEDADGRARGALSELDVAGQRADELRLEMANLKEAHSQLNRAHNDKQQQVVDLERLREQLHLAHTQLQARFGEVDNERQAIESQLAAQLKENGELSASLSDAARIIEETQERVRGLENDVGQREGRIAAQAQVHKLAEQQLAHKDEALAVAQAELAELREKLDEALRGIDERAKWLATRDQALVEHKASLEAERAAKDQVAAERLSLQQQAQVLKKTIDDHKARLDERERLHAAQQQHVAEEMAREVQRTDRVTSDLKELQAALSAQADEANTLKAEVARAVDLRAAEEKARNDALRLRQIAEKAAQDARATRALLEKSEQLRKQTELDAQKARADAEEARGEKRQQEAFALQARTEAEQRAARLRELEALVTRVNLARDASERARVELESDLSRVQAQLAEQAGGERSALIGEVDRLQAELVAARKAQNDAVALARQARAECDQIKRLAADKIRQAQAQTQAALSQPPMPARSPTGTGLPRAATGLQAPAPVMVPASTIAEPTVVHAIGSTPSVTSPGVPQGQVTQPGMASMPSLPPQGAVYEEQKTVLVHGIPPRSKP